MNKTLILNPYEKVDWETCSKHKAALHVHTTQSDGYHHVDEVIRTYRNAGFTVLAITDHDWNEPNRRIAWGELPADHYTPYPKEPLPYNYPANPTWPWDRYGFKQDPQEIGMVGIQGNELTFRHHINSFFNDYGVWYEKKGDKAPYGGIVNKDGIEIWEDDQLFAIRDKRGLAIIDHPGTLDSHSWWERKPLSWYIERFKIHAHDYLIGMEITNGEHKEYNLGLWDQLLARFMPKRPIWGFGNDDMHSLNKAELKYNVLVLNAFNEISVRKAMEAGQFYFCEAKKSTIFEKRDMCPEINSIDVNSIEGSISIEASNYEDIKWISSPDYLGTTGDYKTSSSPWPGGKVIHRGNVLHYKHNEQIDKYVRAEICGKNNCCIAYTNPFGII